MLQKSLVSFQISKCYCLVYNLKLSNPRAILYQVHARRFREDYSYIGLTVDICLRRQRKYFCLVDTYATLASFPASFAALRSNQLWKLETQDV